MKFMSTSTLLPGSVRAAEQFLASGGLEGEGVTLIGPEPLVEECSSESMVSL